jgi:myo-inositol 2-dehydrogenase/D-chiro-inositol 1-dehydrogenase
MEQLMSDQKPNADSRRGFLKKSATAAVGTGVISSITNSAHAAGDDTIRVGLVGCGGRGTGAATQALSTTSGPVKLVAMADVFSDQLDKAHGRIQKQHGEKVAVADDHKFVGFDAYKQLVNADLDLVILATPPGFRPIHFEAAVAANKNIFMEKPVAVDGPGIRKVLENAKIAKQKDLKVGVGLQRHHQWTYMETLKRIHDGAIGDVVAMRCYWNSFGVWDPRRTREQCSGEMEYQMRNWYYYTWLCGDHICEQHIHNLDVCNWVMNDYPQECHGMGGREVRTDKKYGEIFDHFAVEYTYGNGAKMFSQCRHQPATWRSVTEHAHGTKGTSDISGSSISGPNEWKYGRRENKNNPYQTEHDDLFAAIRASEAYNEAENGAMSTLTAIMGRAAVYSGRIVTQKQVLDSQVNLLPEKFDWDAMPKNLPNSDGVYQAAVPGVSKVI